MLAYTDLRELLIERHTDTISLHRLVQLVVRERLSLEARQQWIASTLRLIAGMIAHDDADRVSWAPHALTLAPFVQELPPIETYLQHELMLQLAVGTSLTAIKGYTAPEVEQAYIRALTLCRQLGEPHQQTAVISGLWQSKLVRGDIEASRDLSEQYRVQMQDHAARASQASYALGITSFYLGDFAKARLLLATSRLPREGLPPFSHPDPERLGIHIASLTYLGFTTWLLGYPDQARAYMEEALAHAHALGHAFTSTLVFDHAAILYQWLGDIQKVRTYTRAIEELVRTYGFPIWTTRHMFLKGWVKVMQGDVADGVPGMQEGDAAYADIGASLFRSYHLAALAAARRGINPHEALATVEKALELVDRTNERFWEAELHRLRGDALLALSPCHLTDAEHAFDQSLRISKQQQSKSLELRAAMSLALLWQKQDKKREAHCLLSETYEQFTEGFDTADLQDAKALIERS